MHAIEVALESIHVRGPEPTEWTQPVVQLLKGFGSQPIETALRVHCGFDETGIPQHSQVL
jgi:hypothetical protein